MPIEYVIPFIFLGFFLLALFIRALTTLLHELGHALPIILLKKGKATIYIGSYGDSKNSFHFTIGKLTAWLRYNPFYWRRGVCIPSGKGVSTNKQILYTLGGPLISFLLAAPACYFSFFYDSHGALKLFFLFFMISAVFDLLINIIPSRKPIRLKDGHVIYNDGHNLVYLFRFKKFQKKYARGVEYYNCKEYELAAALFDDLVRGPIENEDARRWAIAANFAAKHYEKALQQHKQLQERYTLHAQDYNSLGIITGFLGLNEESRAAFDQLLILDPDNFYGLCNLGYILTFMNEFGEAVAPLDKAISLAPENSSAYTNRGWTKIRSGDMEGGLADIQKALSLDPNDAYAWRNLGVYYMTKGDKHQALQHFEKAGTLDKSIHLLDQLFHQLQDDTRPLPA